MRPSQENIPRNGSKKPFRFCMKMMFKHVHFHKAHFMSRMQKNVKCATKRMLIRDSCVITPHVDPQKTSRLLSSFCLYRANGFRVLCSLSMFAGFEIRRHALQMELLQHEPLAQGRCVWIQLGEKCFWVGETRKWNRWELEAGPVGPQRGGWCESPGV